MLEKLAPKLRFRDFHENWIKKNIKSISTKITDGTHDTPKPQDNGIPFLTAIHVKDGQIDLENCYYLSKEDHLKIYSRCNPEFGDLLMVNIGAGTATSARVNFSEQFSLKNVALIKPNFKLVDSHFLEQVQRMNSSRLKHQISSGGAQPFLSLKEIGKLKLNLPTLPEQQKIATFLTTVDEKINLLKTQKSELERYKKGVMQKIFSQELRFRDSEGKAFPKWEVKKLGEIGVFQTSSIDKLSKADEKEVYLVNYMNVYRHENINEQSILNFQVVTATESQVLSCNLKKGDILFTPSSETPSDIGHSVVIFEDLSNAVYSYHLMRFRPSIKIDILYSHYFCNIPEVLAQISRLATGSTRFTISVKSFSSIEVKLPCLEEQTKIANFLSALDEKIALVGEQIAKMEVWKKGLLQGMFV